MFMFFIFMFPMFMLACAFVLVGLAAGLGVEVTVVFALALLFELFAVLQATPRTAIAINIKKPVILRMSAPPTCNKEFLVHKN